MPQVGATKPRPIVRPRTIPILLGIALGVLPFRGVAAAAVDVTKPGRFTVGITYLTFTKTSETTGEPRPLETSIWYPAVPGTGTETPIGHEDARVLRRHFPLIVFSHGLCGIPNQSTFLTTALASWGFIVAAPPHPGGQIIDGFPDCVANFGDSFNNRVADIRFVIDSMLAEAKRKGSPFEHRLNRKRIGMSGHSFGGQTTIRVALLEPRVRAALALAPAVGDLVEPSTIKIPTMVQGAEVDSLAPFATESVGAYERLVGPRFLLEILNTGHYAFSDPCAAGLFGGGDCAPGTLTQPEAHTFVLRFAVPFLLRYVAGQRQFAKLLTVDSAPAGVVFQAMPHP
jgi:predicted dienelactone hydrolase